VRSIQPNRKRNLWTAAAIALFWMTVIFATSCRFIDRDQFVGWFYQFLPSESAKRAFGDAWDGGGGLVVVKGYHMLEFALLFLLLRWIALALGVGRRKAAWIAALFSLIYAASDEWHQTFVPGRGGTWVDVCIDFAGVCVAAWVIKWSARRALKRNSVNIGALNNQHALNTEE
jgi:hypothetical protein